MSKAIQHFLESNSLLIQIDLTSETVMDVLSELNGYNTLDQWVINLSGVNKVDSSAVALLLEVIKIAKQHQITLSFQHVPKQLMAIAKLSQLDSFLK